MQLLHNNCINPNINGEIFKQFRLLIICITMLLSQLFFSHTAKSALLKFHCKNYITKESHVLS